MTSRTSIDGGAIRADRWPSSRASLILVSDGSSDALALAGLLARATDGTVLRSRDPVGEATRRGHPGLVVVRSSPRRATRRGLEALVRDAPCPVAIVRRGYADQAPGALRHVGVAFDGWAESQVALNEAVAMATGAAADLCVLMVADPHTVASARRGPWGEDWLLGHRVLADRYLREITRTLPPGIHARHSVLDGQVAPALAQAAATEELDLLVLGSRGLGPVSSVALGSVSHALLRDPPCALLICPRGAAAWRQAGPEKALP